MGTTTTRFPGDDDDAFERFVREAGPGLLRFGHVLTLDRATAEDLVQDTLIRVGLAWSRVRSDGNPTGYAQRTLVNVFLNHRRRRGREVPVPAVPEVSGEDPDLAEVDSLARVSAVLAGLPPKQRAAVVLRYVVGMPDEEIGRLLGCSPATVRSQVSRALSTLRQSSTEAREV